MNGPGNASSTVPWAAVPSVMAQVAASARVSFSDFIFCVFGLDFKLTARVLHYHPRRYRRRRASPKRPRAARARDEGSGMEFTSENSVAKTILL